MKHLSTVLAAALAAACAYVGWQNGRLRRRVLALSAGAAASYSGCVLSGLTAQAADDSRVEVRFPRQRPVLFLAADSGCHYCAEAIPAWVKLATDHPALDNYLVNKRNSYSAADLRSLGLNLKRVLTLQQPGAPYSSLLAATPTTVLAGRDGTVVGVWRGPLNGERIDQIKETVRAIMTPE